MKSNSQSYKEPNFLASSRQPLLLTGMVDKSVKPGDIYTVDGKAKGIVFTGKEVADGDNAPVSVLFEGVVYGDRLNGMTADQKKDLVANGIKFVEDLTTNTSEDTSTTKPQDNGGGK